MTTGVNNNLNPSSATQGIVSGVGTPLSPASGASTAAAQHPAYKLTAWEKTKNWFANLYNKARGTVVPTVDQATQALEKLGQQKTGITGVGNFTKNAFDQLFPNRAHIITPQDYVWDDQKNGWVFSWQKAVNNDAALGLQQQNLGVWGSLPKPKQ